jgi:hypothetical protein
MVTSLVIGLGGGAARVGHNRTCFIATMQAAVEHHRSACPNRACGAGSRCVTQECPAGLYALGRTV